jgi:hypothetical protein
MRGGSDTGAPVKAKLGISDVLAGGAAFEDVIERLPGSSAHRIRYGTSSPVQFATDADRINMLFDALDEAYEHIVIAGDIQSVRDLLATIEGRIDTAVLVNRPGEKAPAADFLGLEVSDLDVIHYEAEPSAPRREAVLQTTASALT